MKTEKFDLEDRTEKFAITVVRFLKQIHENSISKNLISQLLRSSTSIGANYCEANNAHSRNDFKHKISLCRKEAREALYWIRIFYTYLSSSLNTAYMNELGALEKEARELNCIFSAIIHSIDKK